MYTRVVAGPDAPAASDPYSQASVSGQLLFLPGQGRIGSLAGKIPAGSSAQFEQALCNGPAVLRSAGTDLSRAVKLTAYFADVAYCDGHNDVSREWLTEPHPACTAVGARLRGAVVELAALPNDAKRQPGAVEAWPALAVGGEGRRTGAEESHVR